MNEVRSTTSIASQAFDAFTAGRTISANPFPFDSDAHRHWRRVFQQCQREMGAVSPDRMMSAPGASRFAVGQCDAKEHAHA